jgi:uncharacterized protein (DUF1501 family)
MLGGVAGAAVAGAAVTLEARPITRLLQSRDEGPLPSGAGVVVLVTLYGGNDGLNTVIPLDDGHYLGARGALAYQAHEALPLSDGLGLHPNLKGLQQLWVKRKLAVVRGVGYPNPVRSHFRSMDIWQSAAPDTDVATGWIGRWLDRTGASPLRAVSVGSTVPLAMVGDTGAGTAVPVGSFTLPGGDRIVRVVDDLAVASPDRSPLATLVVRSGADLVSASATVTRALASSQPPTAPQGQPANELAAQLQLVRTLIKARVPTRVYSVSLGGFDTHAGEKSTHAALMTKLDTALSDFVAAMERDPRGRGVTVVVYSEFGRRVATNASGGTDHGTAAPVFVLGPPVRGGFYGEEPSLIDLDSGDLKATVDFRSVYATLLRQVLRVDPDVAISTGTFPSIPFV